MDCTVKWTGNGLLFAAEYGSGHAHLMDGPAAYGGQDLAPRPLELVLGALGGCTSFDVVMVLRKKRQRITGCQVELHADRAETNPQVFTHVAVRYIVRGRGLSRDAVERAVSLSWDKYCSVAAMVRQACPIDYTLEVVDEDAVQD